MILLLYIFLPKECTSHYFCDQQVINFVITKKRMGCITPHMLMQWISIIMILPQSLWEFQREAQKTTSLKGSTSYRLDSTFVRPCHWALTVRPFHRALTIINLYHSINTIDESLQRELIVSPAIDRSQWSI